MARIGFAVGLLVALGFPTPAVAQDAPPLQRPPEAALSGSLRTEFAARDAAIEELRALLDPSSAPAAGDTFITGDARLRLDVRLPGIRAAAELATLAYDDGENLPLGSGGGDLILNQLFVDLESFPGDDLTLRLGAFEYAWRIRPHGEPFLVDLGRAESFYSGAGDRDREQAAGALLKWRAGDFVQLEGAWMTAVEGGAASADESLGALLVNFPLSERSAVFLGVLHVHGGDHENVTTYGGGADFYLLEERMLELFGEAWLQSGSLGGGVSRRAWAAQAGTRIVVGPWRAEVSGAWRSGDDDPADDDDGTFQSYEGQERFRIVESAEFGLDWDVNLTSLRLTLARRIGETAEARIDAARFRLDEPQAGLDRDLGLEIDAAVTLEISAAVSAWIAGAALVGSDVLEATPRGDSETWLGTLGVRAIW
jgi:hypothetical protein